jgi:hypothetical protein
MSKKHRIVVQMDASDTWPWVSKIECDWGTDPSRPCRTIHCESCGEDASDECIDGEEPHDGAHVTEGCGVEQWRDAAGMEGIVVENLRVAVPCDGYWSGDGWTLTCKEES